MPVEKMFMFHQPRTDYSIHPQITSSDTEESSSGIVSDQPRQTRTESVYTSEHSPHGSLLSLPHSSAGGMYVQVVITLVSYNNNVFGENVCFS